VGKRKKNRDGTEIRRLKGNSGKASEGKKRNYITLLRKNGSWTPVTLIRGPKRESKEKYQREVASKFMPKRERFSNIYLVKGPRR